MKKKIIFQKCNINYIYFLLYVLSCALMKLIDRYLDPENLIKEGAKKTKYDYINKELLEVYTFNLSDFFAIIPYFIRKKLMISNNDNKNEERSLGNEKSENTEDKSQLELIYNDFKQSETDKRKKYIISILILIGSFDFLKDFVEVFYYSIFNDKDYEIFPFNFSAILDIALQFIFSYLILKTHFYKLQTFCLSLNIAVLVIILILDCIDFINFKLYERPIFIIYPFYLLFYCLKYVFGKQVILYGYISIYLIIILKGIIKLIIVIVFSLLILIFEIEMFKAFRMYFIKPEYVLLIFAKAIINFFSELFVWIIIDRFSPNHTTLIIIGEEFVNFFFDLNDEDSFFIKMGWHKYIRIVLYIISIIGVIIHNEIVVINICGLGSDTKYFLNIVLKNDEEYISSDNPNNLRRFETIEMNEYEDEESEEK